MICPGISKFFHSLRCSKPEFPATTKKRGLKHFWVAESRLLWKATLATPWKLEQVDIDWWSYKGLQTPLVVSTMTLEHAWTSTAHVLHNVQVYSNRSTVFKYCSSSTVSLGPEVEASDPRATEAAWVIHGCRWIGHDYIYNQNWLVFDIYLCFIFCPIWDDIPIDKSLSEHWNRQEVNICQQCQSICPDYHFDRRPGQHLEIGVILIGIHVFFIASFSCQSAVPAFWPS